ncbi:fatty acid oxidation complex subunit alpha FadJ [Providencia burhodogranariea]|uniref:enoyl-CoA hydratase n=1 Tax=Providencia burhodogranariea DSM 19968 TaxID=1141662 RepID=K8X5U0_9GAMM|nr:fatty acid oxidation complex subunit alpha FadJ [Providencia burhodogranariea]EKT63815.1 bifunctional anaerobic fatty acid oxidation complex protein: enoyl-CoA hydratase/epimerase/isomerase (N-terminal); 3-hydroxyacyl-CoA dehydrogenase (C-terminal) [Providencia burhodogranariea DSM 19968]
MSHHSATEAQSEVSRDAFRFEVYSQSVGVIFIDVPNEKVNTLKAEFAQQFLAILQQAQSTSGLKGLVVTSGKKDSFIAGADISMIANCKSKDEASELSREGHKLFDKLENYPLPIIAAIHGICLGGGLELALACHARVCSDDNKTRLGLPEVQLGLLPGSGGTQRLPKLIGIPKALELMLTGRQLTAKQAHRIGLVDDVVSGTILLDVAVNMVKRGKVHRAPVHWQSRLLSSKLFRNKVFSSAKQTALNKTKGHYPAPEKIIQVVKIGMEKGIKAGFEAEAKAFGELVMTPESAALRSLFFATTSLKNEAGALANPLPIKQVGILGGGLMGGGIAFVTAMRGNLPVRIKDVSDKGVTQALRYNWDLLTQRVNKRRMLARERDAIMSRISGTLTYQGLEHADIVVEAVFEDLPLKQRMVAEVQQLSEGKAIFASNTSSLPINQIANNAAYPEKVIGLHYFSPVDKMPLVEVIPHRQTDAETIATTVAFAKRQGKTAIVVGDDAGFYVNRILAPYLCEATECLVSGESIEHIDNALVDFGFPVGPFNLLDEVGIDVGTKILPVLVNRFGDRFKAPDVLDKVNKDDRKGKKNGKGFYLYGHQPVSKLFFWKKNKKRQVDKNIYSLIGIDPKNHLSKIDIAERCVMLMLNESVRCLDEKIIQNARDGDIGAVFGIGFPPFFGGPFRYMDSLGIQKTVDTMNRLAELYGDKFRPCERLCEMAEKNETFFQ